MNLHALREGVFPNFLLSSNERILVEDCGGSKDICAHDAHIGTTRRRQKKKSVAGTRTVVLADDNRRTLALKISKHPTDIITLS